MKIFLLFIMLVTSTTWVQAESSNSVLLSNLPCQDRVYSLLMSWKDVYHWRNGPRYENVQTIKSPTQEIGTWVTVTVEGSSVSVLKSSPEVRHLYTYSAPSCSPVLSSQVREGTPTGFTDKSLKKLLDNSKKKKTKGLIYSWSPNMNLSVTGAQEIVEIAKELGVEVTLIHDSRASEEDLNRVGVKNSQKIGTYELVNRGMETHFPSLLIYKNGILQDYPRPGYDNPIEVKKSLEGQL